jgi:hypothetical protein
MTRGFLTSNLRLKLLALTCAVALWFFVAGQSSTEVRFLVPLGIKGTPKNTLVTSTPPGSLEVRVTGPKLVIHNLSPTQIMADLDLTDAAEGESTYKIRKSDVTTPAGVDVIGVRPEAVEITLERIVKVALPLKVRLQGAPAEGFRVSEVVANPEVVEASGLKKQVGAVKTIYTKPVDVSGLTESRTFPTRVDISELDLAGVNVDRVNVLVKIEKGTEE